MSSQSLFRLGAMVALATVAATACVFISDGGADDESCVDLDVVCPNLVCPAGNVVVDGCAICECIASCDNDVPPATCDLPAQREDCTWTCGQCFDQFECPAGFACDFSGQGADPAPPPDGGGAAPPRDPQLPEPFPGGTCIETSTACFSDGDCRADQICDFVGAPNGLVAPAGVCVDVQPVSACSGDADCGGGRCLQECVPPPGCPACDACFVVGTCVDSPCVSDIDCSPDDVCVPVAGEACAPLDPNCTVSATCQPRDAVSPCALVRCGTDFRCEVQDGFAVCVADLGVCESDQSCTEGLVCTAGVVDCNPPPECDPDVACPDVCFGFCVAP